MIKFFKKMNKRRRVIFLSIVFTIIPISWFSAISILRNRAQESFEAGNYEEAVSNMNILIGIYPWSASAFQQRNFYKLNAGDEIGAEEDLNSAISLDDENYDLYRERGRLRTSNSDYEGAIQDFRRAMQINPKRHEAYLESGLVKEQMGDKTGALADYNEAIKINANDWWALSIRSKLKKEIKDYKGAAEDLAKSIEIGPGKNYDYEGYSQLAEIQYLYLNELENALTNYDKAINTHPSRLEPKQIEDYTFRGSVKKKLTDFNGAIADYQLSLSKTYRKSQQDSTGITIENPYTLHRIGECYLALEKKDSACVYWNMATVKGFKESADSLKKHCNK
jgi:tetratricopeptide (TPR) repeat protein